MNLDAPWIEAIASVASAVVISATVLVGFVQLRHNRNANDIVVFLRLIEQMDSPEFVTARRLAREVARKVAADPELGAKYADPEFIPEDYRPVGDFLRFLEHISLLVARGDVAERLILAEYADTFLSLWELLKPIVRQRRIAYGAYTGRAFEHLAMRSKQYIASGKMQRYYDSLLHDPI